MSTTPFSAGSDAPHPNGPMFGATGSMPSTAAVASVERIQRPWGWYETLLPGPPEDSPGSQATVEGYAIKRLWIAPGGRISLQRHRHRSEHWVVVAGHGLLECGDQRLEARPGTTLFVPVGAIHRASSGDDGLLIVEVQRGKVLREDDIERVADDYGRVVNSADNL